MINKRLRRGALLWFAVAAAGLLLASPQTSAAGFGAGVRLCVYNVLPGLFPFFVVCGLLPSLRLPPRLLRGAAKMLGLQSERTAFAVLLSWVGGYAVCAKLTSQLCGENAISRRDASLLLLLGCCAGPGFVVGSVGGILLGSPVVGVILYVLQLAANLLAAALLLPLLPAKETGKPLNTTMPPGLELPQAIDSAVSNSLAVCGCVIFYSQLAAVLRTLLPGALPSALLYALLEIGGGCAAFAAQGGAVALYGCAAAISLLGLSVWCQLALLLQNTVSLRLLAAARLLHGGIFLLLVHFGVRLLPGAVWVNAGLGRRVIPMSRLPPDAACVGAAFLCAALYKVRQSLYNR